MKRHVGCILLPTCTYMYMYFCNFLAAFTLSATFFYLFESPNLKSLSVESDLSNMHAIIVPGPCI